MEKVQSEARVLLGRGENNVQKIEEGQRLANGELVEEAALTQH